MRKRKRYSEKTIRTYCASTDIWHEKFDSEDEFLEHGNCFACGMDHGYLERAHIKALVSGGEDHPRNIHMLCRCCHQASELIYGEVYYIWFHSRNFGYTMSEKLAQYNLVNSKGDINEQLWSKYQTAFGLINLGDTP